jgi:hypothetical protein
MSKLTVAQKHEMLVALQNERAEKLAAYQEQKQQ